MMAIVERVLSQRLIDSDFERAIRDIEAPWLTVVAAGCSDGQFKNGVDLSAQLAG